jgi:hypothetical protein
MTPAAGMARRAPRRPKSSTPTSTDTKMPRAFTLTVRVITVTWRTLFSNCW